MESLPACRGRKTPCLPITALIYRDIQFKHGKTNAHTHTHCRQRAACIWTGGLSLLYPLTLQTPSDNSIQTWIIPYFCYTLVYASLHSNHVSDASSLGGIKYSLICTQRAMGITKGKNRRGVPSQHFHLIYQWLPITQIDSGHLRVWKTQILWLRFHV